MALPRDERVVTLRRMVQQVGHCVAEALSVIERDEDTRCALDDLQQAELLIEKCLEDARNLQKIKSGR